MLGVRPSHLLASLLSLLLGCSGAGAPPHAPACPEGVPTVAASAVVEVLPPEVIGDAAPPVPVGVEAFADEEVLSIASAAVRSEIASSHVRVHPEASALRIEVDGLGEHAALARCEAVVRAGLQASAREVPSGLREQREQAHRRILELERSLSDVPAAEHGPADPEAYVSWAREASSQLGTAVGVPGALLDRREARSLTSIQRRLFEATKWHAQLADSGKGPRHPDVVEAERRRAALEAWFLEQKRHEAEALKAIVAAWDREEKRRVPKPLAWQRAFARASLAYLESSAEPDAVAFIAPASLRLAAYEAAALAIDEAKLDARYGSRHPRRIVVRAQRQAARDRFERDRVQHVQQLRRRLVELEKTRQADDAPAPTDERTEKLREEREHLVDVILELDRRQLAAEQSAPRMRVRDVCAPVAGSKP